MKLFQFKSFPIRHALSVGCAVLIAIVVNHYFAFSIEKWIVIAALVVSQTTRGTPLRQNLSFSMLMIFAIVISSLLIIFIKPSFLLNSIAAIIFVLFAIVLSLLDPLQNKVKFQIIIFPLILLIAILVPIGSGPDLLQNRFVDIIIGTVIGILCGQLIFPIKLAKEFSRSVIPILQILNAYSQVLTKGFLRQEGSQTELSYELENEIAKEKDHLEMILQASSGNYPEWVYEVGFNPGLRAGFRFFLINLERITEICFSMNYLATQSADATLLQNLTVTMEEVTKKNSELFQILIHYFETNKLGDIQSDFTSDIAELEKTLQQVVPSTLELLDISPYYLTLTAFVRDLKDLRTILLQLVMSLPNN